MFDMKASLSNGSWIQSPQFKSPLFWMSKAKHQDVNITVVYWVAMVASVGVVDIMKQEFSQASLSLVVGL